MQPPSGKESGGSESEKQPSDVQENVNIIVVSLFLVGKAIVWSLDHRFISVDNCTLYFIVCCTYVNYSTYLLSYSLPYLLVPVL